MRSPSFDGRLSHEITGASVRSDDKAVTFAVDPFQRCQLHELGKRHRALANGELRLKAPQPNGDLLDLNRIAQGQQDEPLILGDFEDRSNWDRERDAVRR